MQGTEASALKHWFNEARFRSVAANMKELHPAFNSAQFLDATLPRLEPLPLLARMRLMTESLHAGMPQDYDAALSILRKLAPRIDHNFVSMMLPDYVALYGLEHFELSMDALKYFTTFGSSEFAIRPFLRADLNRTLRVMEKWSRDRDEAVRRLASEGCRPRLPWSFQLGELITNPEPVAPILENLKADPSLYVRKSVANHLNDITRDHPEWTLAKLRSWDLTNSHTAWIAKRGLRTLVKEGNQDALKLIGVGGEAQVKINEFKVAPAKICLGQTVQLVLSCQSTSPEKQLLVIDYTIHYVKKSGQSSEKVFKWKEITVPPGEHIKITKNQQFRNFTTRVHHPGRHAVSVAINGQKVAEEYFDLSC
ncbi:MAG: DNA alkylation repair protein [Verrucomicrobiales bacterium]